MISPQMQAATPRGPRRQLGACAVDPHRVLITEHAVHRFIARYPEDVLPTRPEREIRSLLRTARPAGPRTRRLLGKTLARGILLQAGKWILPLVRPDRRENRRYWDWVLPTVLRADPHANGALAFQRDRVANWLAYRSGEADWLLVSLAAELGTTDVHELWKHWRARGYPPPEHGGYRNFRQYWQARSRLLADLAVAPSAQDQGSIPSDPEPEEVNRS